MNNIFRGQFYVKVPTYWSTYEPIRFLVCLRPTVYAYHSNESLESTQLDLYLIWNISLSGFFVTATMGFLFCARDDVDFVSRSFDLRIQSAHHNLLGILTLSLGYLREMIKTFDALHIVRAPSLDSTR